MANELREKLQKQVVEIISKGLESGEISEDRAREIAKMILEKLPEEIDQKTLMNVIPKLDDEFRELTEIVLPIMIEYETKIRIEVEQKVSQLVKNKKFTEAYNLTKQAIEYTKQYANGDI